MVYLVKAKNAPSTFKGYSGNLLMLVETGNKSIIWQHLNSEPLLDVDRESISVLDELPDMEIGRAVTVLKGLSTYVFPDDKQIKTEEESDNGFL